MTKIYVEASSEEIEGAFAYKALVEDIIADLSLSSLIEEVRIYIDMRKRLFYIEVRRSPTAERIEMKDIVRLIEKGGVLEMEITEEVFAPYLLEILWERFGEDNVNQKRHNILEIRGVKKEDILQLPLKELKEREKKALIHDMIFRVIPIGFRIVRKIATEDDMTVAYLASEDPITEEKIKEIEGIRRKPPAMLNITEEEVIKKRERKKIFAPYKEIYA
ncbi:MAG: methanogenesis marker 17 protein [Candidatus Methanospirareceae archaeon]